MSDAHVQSSQSFEQGNLFFHEKIGTLSLESLVLLDLDHSDNISWLNIWNAITFSVKGELLTVWGALVNFDLESLIVALHLFTLTNFASLCHVDGLALTAALIARASGLTVHAGAHLSHDSPHTSTLTCSTRLDGRSVGAADAITSATNSLPINLEIESVAVVHVSERAFDSSCDWLDASFALLAWVAACKHGENIVHTSWMRAGTLLNTFHTIFIIDFSLFFIE